ncbi:MAG: hypothetical protein ABIG39_02860 [Candidatus Micrarchaeota archaeon]
MKIVRLSEIDMQRVKPILKARTQMPFASSERLLTGTLLSVARGRSTIEPLRIRPRKRGTGVGFGHLKSALEHDGNANRVLFGMGLSIDESVGISPSVVLSSNNHSVHVCFGEESEKDGDKFRGNSVPMSVHQNPCVSWGHSHHGMVYGFDLMTASEGSKGGKGEEPIVMFSKTSYVIEAISRFSESHGAAGMGIGFGHWENVKVVSQEGDVLFDKLRGEGIHIFKISVGDDGKAKYSGRIIIPTEGHLGRSRGKFIGGRVAKAELHGTNYTVFFPIKELGK